MPDPEPDDNLSGLELATRYAVEVEPPAVRGIDQLPAVVAEAVWELLLSGLAVNPRRRGKLLTKPPLQGLHRAGVLGDYRVIYEVDDDQYAVSVLSVRHRADAYLHPGDVAARRSNQE